MLSTYLDVILEERFWSWTVIAILYLVLGLILRGAILNNLFNKIKDLKKEYYHEVKSLYLKNSLYGWFFFTLSLIICVILWYRIDGYPLNRIDVIGISAASLSFFWSVLSHMKAFALAQAKVLRKVVDEKELQASLNK